MAQTDVSPTNSFQALDEQTEDKIQIRTDKAEKSNDRALAAIPQYHGELSSAQEASIRASIANIHRIPGPVPFEAHDDLVEANDVLRKSENASLAQKIEKRVVVRKGDTPADEQKREALIAAIEKEQNPTIDVGLTEQVMTEKMQSLNFTFTVDPSVPLAHNVAIKDGEYTLKGISESEGEFIVDPRCDGIEDAYQKSMLIYRGEVIAIKGGLYNTEVAAMAETSKESGNLNDYHFSVQASNLGNVKLYVEGSLGPASFSEKIV